MINHLQQCCIKPDLFPRDTEENVLGRLWESQVGLKHDNYKKIMTHYTESLFFSIVDIIEKMLV